MHARQIERRVEALEVKLLPPPRSAVPTYLDANFLAYLKGAIGAEAAEKVYAKALDAVTVIPIHPRNLAGLSAFELKLVEEYLDKLEVDEITSAKI